MSRNNTIFVNQTKRALEISKQFNKEASIYGSDAYNLLKAAKKDFPTFRVLVKSSPKKTLEDKITMNDILYYVNKHSGSDSPEMKTLEELRGKHVEKTQDSRFEDNESATFMEIKKWFFLTYPELTKLHEKRQNRINEIIAGAA